jgi:hypothetical protein
MSSVRLSLLLPQRRSVACARPQAAAGRGAAQLIRRRDGGLTFDPIDLRLAQAVLLGARRQR